MLKIAVGHSEDVDTLIAVETVLEQCRRQLGNLVPQAGIVFAGIEYEHWKILTEIRARYPGLELVGCTTAGGVGVGPWVWLLWLGVRRRHGQR